MKKITHLLAFACCVAGFQTDAMEHSQAVDAIMAQFSGILTSSANTLEGRNLSLLLSSMKYAINEEFKVRARPVGVIKKDLENLYAEGTQKVSNIKPSQYDAHDALFAAKERALKEELQASAEKMYETLESKKDYTELRQSLRKNS